MQSKLSFIKAFRWKIAQWFEQKWWKNYLNGKSPEAYLQWKKDYWLKFLENSGFRNDLIEEPLIDIGCGPAGIFMIFDNKDVTAVDPLLRKYEEELEIFSKSNYKKVKFIETDFESFESDSFFKTVFCINAINHFIDIQQSFSKLYQLTDNSGKLVISIDAHNHNFFRFLFRLIPFDILHPHQHNLAEYKAMLQKEGFAVKESICLQKAFFFDYYVLIAEKL